MLFDAKISFRIESVLKLSWEMGSAYAPYILPLSDAGIVVGSPQTDGTYKYYGINSIRRSEMAVIIWRMNNYSGR